MLNIVWGSAALYAIAWLCVAGLPEWFWLIVLLSLAGRLTDPLDLLRLHGYLDRGVAKGLTTGIGSLLPLLVLIGMQTLSRIHIPARHLKRQSAVGD